jgi:hypothetical protein
MTIQSASRNCLVADCVNKRGHCPKWHLLKKSNKLNLGHQQQMPGAMKKSLAAGMPPSSYKDVFTAYFFIAPGICCLMQYPVLRIFVLCWTD